eukprot:TRINITY_DN9001_c0_g3_i1.p1 TRINITY_DN9001_c0_g3~~TRINITY_DN9001_c0_g3_i1.p1  ORF type:complete len:221 (+),score=28.35 TRINITY_DN9001_c0_g3_i1:39-701(+)
MISFVFHVVVVCSVMILLHHVSGVSAQLTDVRACNTTEEYITAVMSSNEEKLSELRHVVAHGRTVRIALDDSHPKWVIASHRLFMSFPEVFVAMFTGGLVPDITDIQLVQTVCMATEAQTEALACRIPSLVNNTEIPNQCSAGWFVSTDTNWVITSYKIASAILDIVLALFLVPLQPLASRARVREAFVLAYAVLPMFYHLVVWHSLQFGCVYGLYGYCL